jgi:hypothetical protein
MKCDTMQSGRNLLWLGLTESVLRVKYNIYVYSIYTHKIKIANRKFHCNTEEMHCSVSWGKHVLLYL